MGIFDKVVNNGYIGEAPDIKGYRRACLEQVNAEAVMDELALFEAQVSGDFAEHQAILTEDASIFTEGVMGDIWNKAKNFFKKIWAKIKQIFNNIMIRINAQFIKKNREFYRKYEKALRKKLLQNLEDLKIETYEHLKDYGSQNKWTNAMTNDLAFETTEFKGENASDPSSHSFKKSNEDFDADDYIENLIKKWTGLDASKGEVRKEMIDELLGDKETFDEEKEVKELGYEALKFLGDHDNEKTLRNLKHIRDSVDKCFTKVLDDVNKAEKACNDLTGSSTSNTNLKGKFSAKVEANKRKALNQSNVSNNDLDITTSGSGFEKMSKKDGTKAHADAVAALANYRSWLSLVTKEVNAAKDAYTEITSARYYIFQEICKGYRQVCVKIYTFNPKKEDSFNEDVADAMMNYINFTEDYEEDIIL